jgi:hypothetical protein
MHADASLVNHPRDLTPRQLVAATGVLEGNRLDKYGGQATIERVALTQEDLNRLRPMTFPAGDKRSDSRYPWSVRYHGDICCELDALGANALRQRVESALVSHLDAAAWMLAGSTEEAEVNSLRDFFATWKQEAA